jgi:hypothetical protein
MKVGSQSWNDFQSSCQNPGSCRSGIRGDHLGLTCQEETVNRIKGRGHQGGHWSVLKALLLSIALLVGPFY